MQLSLLYQLKKFSQKQVCICGELFDLLKHWSTVNLLVSFFVFSAVTKKSTLMAQLDKHLTGDIESPLKVN